jgi:hypothetical protein
MEIFTPEFLIPELGVAIPVLLAVAGVFTAIALASMAEEESAGAVFPWAEWPLPGEAAPPEEVELRRAA